MAQLGSPGVQVNVIDESFYNPATPGTVPLVLFATAQNKTNASGTGVAAGTQASNANTLYLATSQKDLTDRFGVPTFQKDASGNAIQGSELNEYGLFATYSFLGASNSAYVLRANVDLAALQGQASAPTGDPEAGTYWLNTASTRLGIFEWDADAQDFVSRSVTVLNNETDVIDLVDYEPKASIGVAGAYAVVTVADSNVLWYKNQDNTWVKVGSKSGDSPSYSDSLTWAPATDWSSSHPAYTATLPVDGNGAVIPVATDTTFTIATVDVDGTTVIGTQRTVSIATTDITPALVAGKIQTALQATDTIRARLVGSGDGTAYELYSTNGLAIKVSCTGDALYAAGLTTANSGSVSKLFNAPGTQFSSHTNIPFWRTNDTVTVNTLPVNSSRPDGSIWVKTTEFNTGAKWYVSRYNGDTKLFESKTAPVYEGAASALVGLDSAGGGATIAVGTLFVNANYDADGIVKFKLTARNTAGATTISTTAVTSVNPPAFSGSGNITIAVTQKGLTTLSTGTVSVTSATDFDEFVEAVQALNLPNLLASFNASTNQVVLTHQLGGEIYLGHSGATNQLAVLDFGTTVQTAPTGSAYDKVGTNWIDLTDFTSLSYLAQPTQPSSTPADGTLWYASYQDQVDMMIHDGTKWVGLRNYTDFANATVFVQASKPTLTTAQKTYKGHIWVDTSDQDNYGKTIKRWNFALQTWDPVDTTDHTSQYGIIFADARWSTAGANASAATISALYTSNYVDPDAPDPAAYPRGTLLWNTRRSGFNIKQYKKGYITTSAANVRYLDEVMTGYAEDRWVSVSGQDLNQVSYFGRQAQRAYVVGQLKATINSNQRILDEDNIFFNLIACPGYPELISDMVNLNNSRNGTALVVGDTPLRLPSDANSLVNYGTDYYNSGIDGELGLHTNSDHLAVYYPSGLTTDLSGSNVVVPPSHMMLRTIATSDQRSFQWFAPAGTRRGGISNATSVGYLSNGSFIPVSLNQGVRDQMAQIKVNPITNIPGAGLVAFGQYTKSGVNSSLDRINVARLVSYLRRQLGIITKPFLFEPNDKQTRSEIKNVCESLMLDMVSLRGIYDFIVVCDETNNTSSVISNNQLYVDIAIEPVKAVEFIYIPLRLKNVGDIKSRQ